jgi:hypothetical protein
MITKATAPDKLPVRTDTSLGSYPSGPDWMVDLCAHSAAKFNLEAERLHLVTAAYVAAIAAPAVAAILPGGERIEGELRTVPLFDERDRAVQTWLGNLVFECIRELPARVGMKEELDACTQDIGAIRDQIAALQSRAGERRNRPGAGEGMKTSEHGARADLVARKMEAKLENTAREIVRLWKIHDCLVLRKGTIDVNTFVPLLEHRTGHFVCCDYPLRTGFEAMLSCLLEPLLRRRVRQWFTHYAVTGEAGELHDKLSPMFPIQRQVNCLRLGHHDGLLLLRIALGLAIIRDNSPLGRTGGELYGEQDRHINSFDVKAITLAEVETAAELLRRAKRHKTTT